MNESEKFVLETQERIQKLGQDRALAELSKKWMYETGNHKWSYNFRWFGRPAIQFPNDAWAMQEIIWNVRPDLVIESGIAHGGSLIMYASMLAMLDVCESLSNNRTYDPQQTKRRVLGVDIDIRDHNRQEIEAHPMFNFIEMIEGSSIEPDTIAKVTRISKNYKRVLLTLDSNHTHEHVLSELKAYAPLVSVGSYCVVFDTVIEDMPADQCNKKPWAPGNSPKSAVWEFLKTNSNFEIDQSINKKLLITVAPDGFLKRLW